MLNAVEEPLQPLAGIRVLDLTRVMAGPFATTMLVDLGADVTKVESSGAGDIMRHMGGHSRGGTSAPFLSLNRGKRSLSVDLRSNAALDVLRELAAQCDVFIENFRPGVCDALGLGHVALRTANPRLIYVSISGFGPSSPSKHEPAYDTIIQGRSGIVDRQRRGANGEPDLVRSFLVDKVAGFFAAQAVLAALYARERSGEGAFVSVPMFDAALYYAWADGMSDHTLIGDDVTPGTIFPLGQSLTHTSDGHLTHMAMSNRERSGVAKAVGRADLNDDPRFATTASWSRPDNMRAYSLAVRDGFAALTTDDAIAALQSEDVACASVSAAGDVLQDPHVLQSDVFDEWDDVFVGRIRQPRLPIRFDDVPMPVGRTVARRGGHSADVLRSFGIDDARVAALVASGAVEQS
jgi:crotonobetainyl-CoA:carnitine CoA-transferase CaiB-like acyl-CoA transferase